MKSLIIDIKDITDSREVYESRPNPFFIIFIYGLLGMVLAALCFMYYFKIDIAVKSEGIIRTNEDISTVTNMLSGELETVNISDGSSVKQGDILYVIKHDDLLLQKVEYENNIVKAQAELKNLNKYKDSVEQDTNLFNEDEEEYYNRYLNYDINLLTLINNEENNLSSLNTQLASVQQKLADYKNDLVYTNKLIELITSGRFEEGGALKGSLKYQNTYYKYISDYNSIASQYDGKAQSINSDTSGDLNEYSLTSAKDELNGYKTLLDSINNNANRFADDGIYSMLFNQYQVKLVDLNAQYKQAKEIYDIDSSLSGIGVSAADTDRAKENMNQAYAAIDAYKNEYISNVTQKINDLNNKIEQLSINDTASITKEQLLAENDNNKADALDNHRLNTLVTLHSHADQSEESIRNLCDNEVSISAQIDAGFTVTINSKPLPAKAAAYKENEINTVIASLKQCQDSLSSMQTNLARISTQIDNAVVCAQTDGIVNLSIDLVKGDILQSGAQVLTIIPSNMSKFKVSIFVLDKDIAKLKEGMKLKYDIYALPAREYGTITGTIVNISEDIKTNSSSQSAYYLVEASLDSTGAADYNGEFADIKVGMTCKASMITERKRLINYLLEKINLID